MRSIPFQFGITTVVASLYMGLTIHQTSLDKTRSHGYLCSIEDVPIICWLLSKLPLRVSGVSR